MSAIYIGLMSGTSMDGIDAALVDFADPAQPQLLDFTTLQYDDALLQELHLLNRPDEDEVHLAGAANRKVGNAFAAAANQLLANNKLDARQVVAIGSHGQTVRHTPDGEFGFSLQIGDAHSIAVQTGIDVIADFRNKDIALGGQGAPLVPAFHRAVFSHTSIDRAVVNIGGIANISYLPANKSSPVLGFDTGPGNTLMDGWCRKHLNQPYDKDGAWGAGGQADPQLLRSLLSHPYFKEAAPKSTGRDAFHLDWLEQQLAVQPKKLDPQDVQATLLQLTAQNIADGLAELPVAEVYICGGGARNLALMAALANVLPQCKIHTTEELGVDPDAVEGIAFAWLAYAHKNGISGNIPEVTGASRAAILGACYPAA
ncbi:anhydro-N-acetylmuramic acid kinase [Neptunicella sp. SCSIO 80796]|uniref:anhydro-N-acetylmuramic acid kinase n=1 Tax=Neptunicella plasticusilytica TaxID=3117012 RepID=UPI003A4E058E